MSSILNTYDSVLKMGGPDDLGGKITKEGWLYKRGMTFGCLVLFQAYVKITHLTWGAFCIQGFIGFIMRLG
jgi:hypothetical protein